MEILIADVWGMCKGLRLIMHRTRQTLQQKNGEPVYIYRSLVHNEQSHKALFDMGVQGIAKTVEEVPLGSTVIVGPHSASVSN
jgi:4-hydroxy-3-methylbut-2-enyl diphosphate reductase IspH